MQVGPFRHLVEKGAQSGGALLAGQFIGSRGSRLCAELAGGTDWLGVHLYCGEC